MKIYNIIFLITLITFTAGKAEEPTADSVIISLALSWHDLWKQDATLEEVDQKQRDETINEVLIEIGNKMKRRNKVTEMNDFHVKKVQ